MNHFGIFTDRHGRRWVCGYTLKVLFGIVETGNRHFWNYDKLCQQSDQRRNAHASNKTKRRTR